MSAGAPTPGRTRGPLELMPPSPPRAGSVRVRRRVRRNQGVARRAEAGSSSSRRAVPTCNPCPLDGTHRPLRALAQDAGSALPLQKLTLQLAPNCNNNRKFKTAIRKATGSEDLKWEWELDVLPSITMREVVCLLREEISSQCRRVSHGGDRSFNCSQIEHVLSGGADIYDHKRCATPHFAAHPPPSHPALSLP